MKVIMMKLDYTEHCNEHCIAPLPAIFTAMTLAPFYFCFLVFPSQFLLDHDCG